MVISSQTWPLIYQILGQDVAGEYTELDIIRLQNPNLENQAVNYIIL